MADNAILLIDPFENVLTIYRTILEEEGFQVDTLTDFNESVQLFSIKHYPVVIMEYLISLEETCHFIQGVKKEASETYIILNTSIVIDDLAYEKLFASGLDDYLLKPYAPGKLLIHIKKGLRQKEVILENKEKEKQSLVDPIAYKDQQLIFNQSFFKTLVRQELKKAKRHQQPLSLLLLKLPTKETMGSHHDSFYCNLMKVIRNSVREEDLLGRENGHLGILLNQTDQAGSQILEQRLSELIQSHPSLKTTPSITPILKNLSFQNYTFPSQGESRSEFINRLLEEIEAPTGSR